jgi:Flp pilus assembly protein TadG
MPLPLPGCSAIPPAIRSALRLRLRNAASRIVPGQRLHTRFFREEAGGALIEFGLTISALLMAVFTLMQLCIMFYSYAVIADYAREGTRYASTRGTTCVTPSSASCTATAASISSYVTGLHLPNIGGGTVSVTTTFPDGNEAPLSRVKVAVTYTVAVSYFPFVPKHTLALRSESVLFFVQ